MIGLILNAEFDLVVSADKDANGLIAEGVAIGDNTDQCAALVLSMAQGDLKEDPLLGCGLTRFIRGRYNPSNTESRIRLHFARAGIRYDDYSSRLTVAVNAKQL